MKAFRILCKKNGVEGYQKVRGYIFADGLAAYKMDQGWRVIDLETGIAVDKGPAPKMREYVEEIREYRDQTEREKKDNPRKISFSDGLREVRRRYGTIRDNLGVDPTEFADDLEFWPTNRKKRS